MGLGERKQGISLASYPFRHETQPQLREPTLWLEVGRGIVLAGHSFTYKGCSCTTFLRKIARVLGVEVHLLEHGVQRRSGGNVNELCTVR